jgi:hypothetical protein
MLTDLAEALLLLLLLPLHRDLVQGREAPNLIVLVKDSLLHLHLSLVSLLLNEIPNPKNRKASLPLVENGPLLSRESKLL